MWRLFHSIAGLGGLLLIALLAITGVLLSTAPALDVFGPNAQFEGDLTIAEALATLSARFPEIDGLEHTSGGAFILQHRRGQVTVRDYVDIRTGKVLGPEKESPFYSFVKELHRSLRLGNGGRLLAGIGAGLMTFLCFSGSFLLVKRFGGVQALLGPARGSLMERLHSVSGRSAVVPLLAVGITGLYLTFIAFQLVASGSETPPPYPESRQELEPVSASTLVGLQQIRLADMREVLYPIPGDWFDVFAVKTNDGYVFIDQFSGEVLTRKSYNRAQLVLEWVTLIHTGEGAWAWALILGLFVLSVPVFAVSGLAIWLTRLRRRGGRVASNIPSSAAEIAVLVGSENGTTWGFARNLHEQLTAAGKRVHLASMNELRPVYPKAEQLLLLTSTYGDGHAPKSASRFLAKLATQPEGNLPPFAVLGFGDKSFEHYCRFSLDTDDELVAHKMTKFMQPAQIDRASAQAFAQWGRDLGKALDISLELNYSPPRPSTQELVLTGRTDYGAEVGAPTAILRFSAVGPKLPKHVAGDLIGILAPGSDVPRYYSLASNSGDGHLEICVRLMPDGQCSSFLHSLLPGTAIDGYVRRNPDFHMPGKNAPVLMIGAGTGIAPFIGMIRHARGARPIELYWGGRAPESDFLYEATTRQMVENGRLACFHAAFSRGAEPSYVQDRLRENAEGLLSRLAAGAVVMVCGGSAMAAGVRAELEPILMRLGTDIGTLRRQRRYFEDIY
jgi:sulfite reductase (NADPH) flavoprotein alpha-component